MIVLSGVSKTYQGRNFLVEALMDIDLDIENGQFLSIVGKSGSGKSSLLKIIGLMDFDYTGDYRYEGVCYREGSDFAVSAARKSIGFVFQDFQLVPRYTVQKNLEIAAVIRGQTSRDQRHVEVRACLARVGLLDKALSYPDELSGGQKQRIAVARAIVGKPHLIVADEPTGSLDTVSAEQLVSLLREIQKDIVCTLILVTHDKDVAEKADRIIELAQGRVKRDFFL